MTHDHLSARFPGTRTTSVQVLLQYGRASDPWLCHEPWHLVASPLKQSINHDSLTVHQNLFQPLLSFRCCVCSRLCDTVSVVIFLRSRTAGLDFYCCEIKMNNFGFRVCVCPSNDAGHELMSVCGTRFCSKTKETHNLSESWEQTLVSSFIGKVRLRFSHLGCSELTFRQTRMPQTIFQKRKTVSEFRQNWRTQETRGQSLACSVLWNVFFWKSTEVSLPIKNLASPDSSIEPSSCFASWKYLFFSKKPS